MTIKLTDEQEEAVKRDETAPVRVSDASGKTRFVLLPAEDYERIRSLLEENDDLDIRETYLLQEQVARAEGWDDPALDVYNDYVNYRPPQESP